MSKVMVVGWLLDEIVGSFWARNPLTAWSESDALYMRSDSHRRKEKLFHRNARPRRHVFRNGPTRIDTPLEFVPRLVKQSFIPTRAHCDESGQNPDLETDAD